MAESPAEYIAQLRERVASLETALRMCLHDREDDRARAREDRAVWQQIAGDLRAALSQIATLKPSESNGEVIDAFFTARRVAREALGK